MYQAAIELTLRWEYNSVQEILRWFDPEALSILGYERDEPTGRDIAPLALIEHDSCSYKYTK